MVHNPSKLNVQKCVFHFTSLKDSAVFVSVLKL